MDSFLHNIYEVCVDGLHFTEWKHFLCIFIRFSSGMQRKEGERAGEREGEGRSVQEHVREEARDETPAGDSWQLFFTDFVRAEPRQRSCCPHAPRGVRGGTERILSRNLVGDPAVPWLLLQQPACVCPWSLLEPVT